MAFDLLGDLKKTLENEFGDRLEEATEVMEDLRRQDEKVEKKLDDVEGAIQSLESSINDLRDAIEQSND